MISSEKLVLSLFFWVVTMVGQKNWPVQDISLEPKGFFIKIGVRSLEKTKSKENWFHHDFYFKNLGNWTFIFISS